MLSLYGWHLQVTMANEPDTFIKESLYMQINELYQYITTLSVYKSKYFSKISEPDVDECTIFFD